MRFPLLDKRDKSAKDIEFFMYQFKTRACTVKRPHEWKNCCYVHENEKARRRDPRVYDYAADPCPVWMEKGSCPKGDACRLAHGVFETWLHPSKFCTVMCTEGQACRRKVCWFAHSPGELRAPTPALAAARSAQPPDAAAAAAAAAHPGAASSSTSAGNTASMPGASSNSTNTNASMAGTSSSFAAGTSYQGTSHQALGEGAAAAVALQEAAAMAAYGASPYPQQCSPIQPAAACAFHQGPTESGLTAAALQGRMDVYNMSAQAHGSTVNSAVSSMYDPAVAGARRFSRASYASYTSYTDTTMLGDGSQQLGRSALGMYSPPAHIAAAAPGSMLFCSPPLLGQQQGAVGGSSNASMLLHQPQQVPGVAGISAGALPAAGCGVPGLSLGVPPSDGLVQQLRQLQLQQQQEAVPLLPGTLQPQPGAWSSMGSSCPSGSVPVSIMPMLPANVAAGDSSGLLGGGSSSLGNPLSGLLSSLEQQAVQVQLQAASAQAAAAAANNNLHAVLSALGGVPTSQPAAAGVDSPSAVLLQQQQQQQPPPQQQQQQQGQLLAGPPPDAGAFSFPFL